MMASFSTSQQATLTGFFSRNARLIAGVGLFVTFWMLVYTFVVYKPGYAAKATVIIKDSAITSRYIESEQYYALQTTSSSSSNPVLNTMGILKSGAISEALLAYFQSKHPEELKKNKIKTKKDWDSFYQDGSSFIKAKNQPGTDLIAIQFSWSNPIIAKEALIVVVKAFQDASRDLNKEEQISRTKFLKRQVGEIEEQLATIRAQKSAYQSNERTVSVKREGDDLAGSRMELSNKLSQLESQAQGKENMARRYQQLLGMDASKALTASAIGQNSSMSKLQDELYRLQQQYSLLNSSLTENNPKVREVQAQIEQVKANIEAETIRTMGHQFTGNPDGVVADGTRNTLITNMVQAQGEGQDLRAQASIIRKRLQQIDRDIKTFPGMAEGLANIEQKEASLSQALDQLREKVLEGRLKEEQTLSNVFIVDAPRLPEKPQFPNRSHLLVLSVLLGFGVGVASAFAREQFTSRDGCELPEWLEPVETDSMSEPAEERQLVASRAWQSAQREPARPVQPVAPVLVPQPREVAEERVELPVIGSLFDSLVPVAGPMAQKQAQVQPVEFRRDLTRPLPKADVVEPSVVESIQDLPQHPVVQDPQAPIISVTDESTALAMSINEHVVPTTVSDDISQPAKTVKMAVPIDPTLLAELHNRSQNVPRPTPTDVPVLHASLPITPLPQSQPEQMEYVETPETVSLTDSEARDLYDAQAKEMPLPRRRNRIPAFLLDGEPVVNEMDDESQPPYTLVPKKQLLSATDDLMQDVAPLEPTEQQAVSSVDIEESSDAVEQQDQDFEPLHSPIPAFMREESVNVPLQPLLSGFRFGRKPSRNPERFFGLGARAAKKQELPSSLTRMMQTLDKNR